MKKNWRNLSWKDLDSKERIVFIALGAAAAWLIVMALFYKVWSIPDWVGYLWIFFAAAVLYALRRVMNERMGAEAGEDDEETDEESIEE